MNTFLDELIILFTLANSKLEFKPLVSDDTNIRDTFNWNTAKTSTII